MSAVKNNLIHLIPLPAALKGRLSHENQHRLDVKAELEREIETLEVLLSISPGQKIAVTVADQGMTNLVEIVQELITRLRSVGAEPFIVPAIGGGERLSADEQKDVLASIGITEQAVGAPIYSSMESILIGESRKGIPVFLDRYAYEADGIIVLNRTKFHGGYSSDYKSGLLRMITVGLGKQSGFSMCRTYGSAHIGENIAEVARFILKATNFLFGVAVTENQYKETTHIKIVTRQELYSKENNSKIS